MAEVLRRIAGKVIMMIFKKDITDAIGSLQVRSGSKSRSSHSRSVRYANEDAETVFIIDAENVFSSINQKVTLHNLNFI